MNERNRGKGVDLPRSQRPGVPMEHAPHKLQPGAPEHYDRMRPRHDVVHRAELPEMTPVFGTAQPLHGVSGLVRRIAYGTRETKARHWLLLLMADRIDVLEHRIARLLKVAAIVPVGVAAVALAMRFLRD
jgi:hypothetical protein